MFEESLRRDGYLGARRKQLRFRSEEQQSGSNGNGDRKSKENEAIVAQFAGAVLDVTHKDHCAHLHHDSDVKLLVFETLVACGSVWR